MKDISALYPRLGGWGRVFVHVLLMGAGGTEDCALVSSCRIWVLVVPDEASTTYWESSQGLGCEGTSGVAPALLLKILSTSAGKS